MRAVMQDAYGSVDVLQVAEVDPPVPKPGEVRLRVRAAGVNLADWHMMTGEPTVSRLALGLRAPRQRIRGIDVAGVVESVGDEVSEYRVGDEVFGSAHGSFAELACSAAKRLVSKPASVSFEQAGAASMAGYTALQALRAAGITTTDEGIDTSVLIIGAAGGVGSFAVQLAKHFGAHVTGVCSTRKLDFVRSLGADAVVDYTSEEIRGRFDVVIDLAGGRSVTEGRSLLTETGVLVIVGGEGGGRMFGLAGRSLEAPFRSLFTRQKLVGLFATEHLGDLGYLGELLAAGTIRTAIDRTFPLDEAPEALRAIGDGQAAGKFVILP